jgi:hypothetical protein
MWTDIDVGNMPPSGEYLCRIRSFTSGETKEVLLTRVEEEDCTWRVGGASGPEFNEMDWDVTHYYKNG